MAKQRGLVLLELLAVLGMIGVVAAVLWPVLIQAMALVERATCANNLRHLGTVFKMYAAENSGAWPVRNVPYHDSYNPRRTCWSSFDGVFLYPDYLEDIHATLCPSDTEDFDGIEEWLTAPVACGWQTAEDSPVRGRNTYPQFADFSYVYWGYVIDPAWITGQENVDALGEFMDLGVHAANRWGDLTLILPETQEQVTLHRYQEGVERWLFRGSPGSVPANAAAQIPVMWDTIRAEGLQPVEDECNHLPLAANVLFLDGHAAWAQYPRPEHSPFWMLSPLAQACSSYWFP
ncbi:MAG: hypothetical protein HYV26_05460 [Candidatus Hydrogenedentes bacterium]|nr:hypothetical protein [Candidatus Hydrogenedentota bacterium]